MRREKIFRSKVRKNAIKAGFRSGLEHTVAKILDENNIEYQYEPIKLEYEQKTSYKNFKCMECGCKDILQERKYTPDFVLIKSGKVLEVKGRFVMADRKKIMAVLKNNPDLNFTMVFQNHRAKISRGSKFTYMTWCNKYNIDWVSVDNLGMWLKRFLEPED
jgi:hypothetical protein